MSLVLRACLLLALASTPLLTSACSGATETVDARYSTPEHTANTLFSAYGIEALSGEDVRARMSSNARFDLHDRATFVSCFRDLETTTDEGLAGFVFGALAAGKDNLRTEILESRATMSPRTGVEIVFIREEDGRWLISLAESVPAEVRTRLGAVAADTEQRQRRGIPTSSE
jgi:hypothetical protein